MPNKVTRKLPSFEGVAAGATAVCNIKPGLTLHKVLISYSGATLAQLNAIRFLINGKVVQSITECARLDYMNTFDGMAAAGGVLTLNLERYGLRTREGEEYTAVGTGIANDPQRVVNMSIEIDIDAAAVGPALSAKGIFSAPRPLGNIKHVREFIRTSGGAGVLEVSDLPRLGVINRIFLGEAATTVNSVRIERDGYTVFERSTAENDVCNNDGVRVTADGYWVIDPTEEGNGAEGIEYGPDVKDLRLYIDCAGAGAVPLIVEYIGPLAN